MTAFKHCPQCQRRNQPDATHCAYCGIQFADTRTVAFATREVDEAAAPVAGTRAHCTEYLETLPIDQIAFFVNREKEPIVLQAASQIVVGRHLEDMPVPTIDLAPYAAVDLGVSRRHAQFSFEDGTGTVTDLGSTNGTWLNQRLLTPGIAYPVYSDDQILLGQLRLSLCFHAKERAEEIIFFVRDFSDSPGKSVHLSPSYFAEQIMPYLQAVIELQHVIDWYKDRAKRDIHITAINAVKGKTLIMVSLDGAAEAIVQIIQWVNPWREAQARVTDKVLGRPSEAQERSLHELGLKILAEVAPDTAETDLLAQQSQLASALGVLSALHLEISMEPMEE